MFRRKSKSNNNNNSEKAINKMAVHHRNLAGPFIMVSDSMNNYSLHHTHTHTHTKSECDINDQMQRNLMETQPAAILKLTIR